MSSKTSQTAISILTLLNNVDELIRVSQDRQNAKEVMRCLVVYADTNSFPIPKNKINNFHRVCLDSRAETLSALIHNIAKDVIHNDKIKEKNKRAENRK